MCERPYAVTLVTTVVLLALAAIPGAAATIIGITIDTNDNTGPYGGLWTISAGGASIGATAPGATNNPLLNSGTSLDVVSGSYLLFLGYEDRFANGAIPAGVMALALTVSYSDNTNLSAIFVNDVLTSPSIWTRVAGSSLLVIGSSGITNVDRNGDFPAGVYGSNGVSDIVLEFSDTGTFESGTGTPEPTTLGLTTAGVCAVCYLRYVKRRRSGLSPRTD